jgi:hypothetical protein
MLIFHAQEKVSPKFIQDALHFCNLLPDKARYSLDKELGKSDLGKILCKEMKIKAALKEKVDKWTNSRDFIYLLVKHNMTLLNRILLLLTMVLLLPRREI